MYFPPLQLLLPPPPLPLIPGLPSSDVWFILGPWLGSCRHTLLTFFPVTSSKSGLLFPRITLWYICSLKPTNFLQSPSAFVECLHGFKSDGLLALFSSYFLYSPDAQEWWLRWTPSSFVLSSAGRGVIRGQTGSEKDGKDQSWGHSKPLSQSPWFTSAFWVCQGMLYFRLWQTLNFGSVYLSPWVVWLLRNLGD